MQNADNPRSTQPTETGSAGAPMRPGDEAPPGTPGTAPNVCRRCGGSGRIESGPCPDCAGTGQVNVGIGGA